MKTNTQLRRIAAPLLGLGILALAGCYATGGATYEMMDQNGYVGPAYTPDDYLYYPSFGLYYSPYQRAYFYHDRDRWERESAPPAFFNSDAPSVHVHLRRGPERDDDDVRRRYPRDWRGDRDGD